jgi:hypothetical protein
VHFRPEQRREIPSTGFDLYLSIDDDTEHAVPDSLGPLAYWTIDTHRGFDLQLERVRRADLEFAAQRDGHRVGGLAPLECVSRTCTMKRTLAEAERELHHGVRGGHGGGKENHKSYESESGPRDRG